MEVEWWEILMSLHRTLGSSWWFIFVRPSDHHPFPGKSGHSSLQSPNIQDKLPYLLGRFELSFSEPELGNYLLLFVCT